MEVGVKNPPPLSLGHREFAEKVLIHFAEGTAFKAAECRIYKPQQSELWAITKSAEF